MGNLMRDRQLLELAKREAPAVMAGPNSEITQVEVSRALVALRTRWQHTYGLVEVGKLLTAHNFSAPSAARCQRRSTRPAS